jgi:hypothetical protein
LVGISYAQGLTTERVAGVIEMSEDALGNPMPSSRLGSIIYKNDAISAWWSGSNPGYLYMDWGVLAPQGTDGLDDEVVDGFLYTYGTNNMDPNGEDFTYYFFDSTTGYANQGVLEATFIRTGLPNGYGRPPLAPGYGWTYSMTSNLEGQGYEFLLRSKDLFIGWGQQQVSTPLMGSTGFAIGQPSNFGANWTTGTVNESSVFDPSNVYLGTVSFSFGGPTSPVWATWPGRLYGAQDPAQNMTYYGQNSQGNTAMFYTTGDWLLNNDVNFFLRKNGNTLPGWVLASLQVQSQYLPTLGVTRLVGTFVGPTPMLMNAGSGDFDVLTYTVQPVSAGQTIYIQGAITALNPIAPADAANGVYSN